jgi:large subunit ribosomal protein L6
MPINVPQGVTITLDDNFVTVEGQKGKLSRQFQPTVSIKLESDVLVVSRASDSSRDRAMHGLSRTLLANMVEGVDKGFVKTLEITGVGYRAQKSDEKLVLQIGFSHPVEFTPPPGVDITVEGTNRILVSGINKEDVGETAARIRRIRRCDSYKGKGIRYAGEKLRLKPGKAGKTALRR